MLKAFCKIGQLWTNMPGILKNGKMHFHSYTCFLLLLNCISPIAILLVLGVLVVELVSLDELALSLALKRVDFLLCLSCFSFIISSTNLRFLFSLSELSWDLFFENTMLSKHICPPFLTNPFLPIYPLGYSQLQNNPSKELSNTML